MRPKLPTDRKPERTSPHTLTSGPSASWASSAPSDLRARRGAPSGTCLSLGFGASPDTPPAQRVVLSHHTDRYSELALRLSQGRPFGPPSDPHGPLGTSRNLATAVGAVNSREILFFASSKVYSRALRSGAREPDSESTNRAVARPIAPRKGWQNAARLRSTCGSPDRNPTGSSMLRRRTPPEIRD